MKELLEKRKATKAKKPSYRAQDSHKLSRIQKGWRKPRGIDSKVRLNLKGYSKKPQMGYGSPKEIRGFDKSGKKMISVSSLKDLEGLDKEKQAVVILSSVGKKKRIDLVEKASGMGITVLNIDVERFKKDVEADMKKRKEEKTKRKKRKEEAEKKKEEKPKKEEKLTEKVMTEEEKAQAQKKEKDKVLTTKE